MSEGIETRYGTCLVGEGDEVRYDKYFVTAPEEKKGLAAAPGALLHIDGDIMEGALRFGMWYVSKEKPHLPHGPHWHKHAEVLTCLSSDMDDPQNLGGEVEIWLGPELEKHIITKSTIIFIPPKMIHCPILYRPGDRPIIMVSQVYSNELTETPCKNLIPEEDREKFIFFDTKGGETMEEVMSRVDIEKIKRLNAV